MKPRTWVAAALLAGALAVLLVAWFASGWADVRARQRAIRDAPALAAENRAGELARELHAELAALLAREVGRPYFYYQNLFHDPRAGGTRNVAPSPLAGMPEDPLVLGYFQIDSTGRVTTPTINDDAPELSEPTHLAEHRRFRDEAIRSLAVTLSPHGDLLAASGAAAARQVVRVDPSTYVQNAMPTAVYHQQNAVGPQAMSTPGAPASDAPAITITVSPLEWRTLAFAGSPALIGVRRVETPDGLLAQGFVVDRATLTSWLATHAGDAVAELHPGDGAAELAPGWYVTVAANPRTLAAAAREASSVASGFLVRFVAVGLVAVGAALLVVLLVARAEKLARERSQFAAAAAHELRTPLAGLQLYGDMLADGLGDPAKARDYARRMSEEASRLGRVVSNVLGFSQLERGNLSVDPRIDALADALQELADRAQPALARAGAALELEVEPALSARFDRDALARIVGNLLDNAEKYAREAGDRTIALSAKPVADAIEVSVRDHGPGVAAQARSRLFRPFARGVSSDGPAGLGLGLALSQSLARAMGGDLEYRAAAGGGAAFVLRLARS